MYTHLNVGGLWYMTEELLELQLYYMTFQYCILQFDSFHKEYNFLYIWSTFLQYIMKEYNLTKLI